MRSPLPRIFRLLGAFLLLTSEATAQSDTWTRVHDVTYNGSDGPRVGLSETAFAIGDKGYVFASSGMLWEYDPATDAWTARTAFPAGAAGNRTVAFSIGGLGIVCQLSGPASTWAFDPADGSWTARAPFPGQGRTGAGEFVLDGKGYVAGGNGTVNSWLNDLWMYDPVADTWTQKANLPGLRASSGSFAVDGRGYIIGGTSSLGSGDLTYTSTTYAYDPVSNTWAQRAGYPGGTSMRMVGFAIGGRGYMGCGVFSTTASRKLYSYDPVANAWSTLGTFGSFGGRDSGFGMAIGDKGYIGGGRYYGNFTMRYTDFWCFDPATTTFTPRQYLGGMDQRDCSVFAIGSSAQFMEGNRNSDRVGQETWSYAPATDTWTKRANVITNYAGSATFTIDGQGYKVGGYTEVPGSPMNYAFRYDPGTDVWSAVTSLGSTERRSLAVGFSANGKGYVGLGVGTSGVKKNDLWQYDPVAGTWTRKADFPGAARQQAVAFRIGDKIYVGTGMGSARLRDMWAYDPATDTWTQKADFGGTARYGAVAFAIGGKGYIATGDDGALKNDLWEYDPVEDTWTQKADFGGVPRRQAMAFVVGAKAYVGTGATNTTGTTYAYDLWEYTPVGDDEAVRVRAKALLDGPYDSGSGLMSDALRTAGLVPLTEPYTALGYVHATSGGERTVPAVLAVGGPDAIVDWVVVELRHTAQPGLVVASACALLQRDGDVVGTDGISPVVLPAAPGNYHVALRHRNHLGVMTLASVALSTTPIGVDLTDGSRATFGSNAQKTVGAVRTSWCGNVVRDNTIKYIGSGNDRDPVLGRVGGSVPTATVSGGYWSEDVNMDGTVKYLGSGNDRDRILQTIGGNEPTAVRHEQLP